MSRVILVAEDDKFLANAYRVKLVREGFEVVIATDGQETMAAMKKQKPDLLLLDIIMPNVDGFWVLEEMKKDPSLAKIPVVVASNLGQKEDIDRSYSLGADDYVVKADMTLDDLIKKIKSYLKLS